MHTPGRGAAPRRVLAALVAVASGACAPPAPTPPDLVVITLDTTRADRLGAYGYRDAATPHLDQLAREGATFEQHRTTAPITLPAHASIWTGLLPPAHGLRDNGVAALPLGATTLAELLADDYDTAAFISAEVLAARYRLDQGFAHYDDEALADPGAPFAIAERRGAETVAAANAFLDARREAGATRPLLLWLHLFDPHLPRSSQADACCADPYDAEIGEADRAIGQLLDRLRRDRGWTSTAVVVTADHGEGLGEHGERTHGAGPYDSTMRVPLIVRWPGRIPPGLRVAASTSAVDLLPTILGLLHRPAPTTDGVDLGPLLYGNPSGDGSATSLQAVSATLQRRDLYMESAIADGGSGRVPLRGLRRGDTVWIQDIPPERYDLATDPAQLHNLHPGDPAPGVLLDAAFDAFLPARWEEGGPDAAPAIDAETAARLAALGYTAGLDRAAERLSRAERMAAVQGLDAIRASAAEGDWDAVDRRLAELLSRTPDHVAALNLWGWAARRRGDAATAREAYRRSLQQAPGQAAVVLALAGLDLSDGDLEGADVHAQEALALMPGYADASALLSVVSERAGRWTEAERWAEAAAAADPHATAPRRALAALRLRQGRWAEAERLAQGLLADAPDDLDAQLQAGVAALRMGQMQSAAASFATAEARHPDSWLPPYNLACHAALTGDVDGAFDALGRASSRGMEGASHAEQDPDLARLRSDPRWEAWRSALEER